MAGAALALLRAAAAGDVGSLLAQLLQAHLQAHALEVAPGHRAAAAALAALLLALATSRLQPAHRRPLRAFAALATAALLPLAAFLPFLAAHLLAALLQALAHRLEALLLLLQPLPDFGALARLAVRALRLRALLGGGERKEQAEHEHQTSHAITSRGVGLIAGNALGAADPTRTCKEAGAFLRARRCHRRLGAWSPRLRCSRFQQVPAAASA